MHRLSRTDARRIAVRAQLLASPRPADLLDVARRLTLLHLDGTTAVAPSAELIAWSRLGAAFAPDDLSAALEAGRLIEFRGVLRPAEDMVLYRAEMADWPGPDAPEWRHDQVEWLAANDDCRIDILHRLGDSGPLTSREIPDTCLVPWRSTGWNNNRNVPRMLELMALRGEVAVAGRAGRERWWDLAERIYPDDPVVPLSRARRIRDERRLVALGIARASTTGTPDEPNDVGPVGEPAVVDGVRGEWRVDPGQLDLPFRGRTAVLSPFDRLVYDRARMEELFEFDYQLEMYKPAAKRRWGYFALPILYGDRLVGKVDATADRAARVLAVTAVHRDVPFTTAMDRAVTAEITDLARLLGLAPCWP